MISKQGKQRLHRYQTRTPVRIPQIWYVYSSVDWQPIRWRIYGRQV